MAVTCSVVLILFGESRSMNLALDRRIEYFNEATILICTYHLFIFTDFVQDPEPRYTMGYSVIFFALMNIMTNLIAMIYVTLKVIIKKFKVTR